MIPFTIPLTRSALLVFDPVDVFARDSGFRGEKPRPIGTVRYDLLAREVGGALEPFPAELATVENASGYHLFFGRTRTPAIGRPRPPQRLTLLPGSYRVRALATHYQTVTVTAEVTVPDRPKPVAVNLLPGFDYPFPSGRTAGGLPGPTLLRGSLRRADGAMIENAEVFALFPWPKPPLQPGDPPPPKCVTGKAGQWVIALPDPPRPSPETSPPKDISVRVVARFDGRTIDLLVRRVPYGLTTGVGQSGLRGRVVRRDGRPAGGTAIAAAGVSGPLPGRAIAGDDGAWAYYLPPELSTADRVVMVTATASDGGTAATNVLVPAGKHKPIPNLVLDR